MYESIQSIAPLLALWGAFLSTYLFVVSQIDRRRKKKANLLVKLSFEAQPVTRQEFPYEIGTSQYSHPERSYFPFHFVVTNHSSFSLNIRQAILLVAQIDYLGEPRDYLPTLRMGMVKFRCFKDEPERTFMLQSRETVSLVPLDESYFREALDCEMLGYNMLIQPVITTSTDGNFSGCAFLPHDPRGMYIDSVFEPVTEKYRDY